MRLYKVDAAETDSRAPAGRGRPADLAVAPARGGLFQAPGGRGGSGGAAAANARPADVFRSGSASHNVIMLSQITGLERVVSESCVDENPGR